MNEGNYLVNSLVTFNKSIKNKFQSNQVESDTIINDVYSNIISIRYHLKDQTSNIIGVLIFFEEINYPQDRKKLVSEIEIQTSISEIVAEMAHQIRNPLTILYGFVQYLKNELSRTKQFEYINIILEEMNSINALVKQWTDFSLPLKQYKVPTYLNRLIERALLLVKVLYPTKNLDFTLLLNQQLSMIRLNDELIKQVLINIIINAVQASKEKGEIIISTHMSIDQKYQVIRIKDHGTAIRSEIMQNIFMPFFTTKQTGTGLGLAIVKKIIALHQGIILIQNNENNIGVTVEIALPNNRIQN